jgi:hypothetical protein
MKGAYQENTGAFANVGDITLKSVDDGFKKEAYFVYNGPAGIITSDFINLASISYAKAISATDNGYKLRKIEISLNREVNGGVPVAGQDYILGINFKNFFSSGDASQYYKDAAVHVTSAITDAKGLFDAMKDALNVAFSREDNATLTSNPYLTFDVSGSGSSAKLTIEEKEQEWILGTMPQRRILFDVFPSTIYTGGDDVIWAAQDATTGNYYTEVTENLTVVGNGKRIADLEWFCCGERGDQYRGMGYPNVIHTEYLVDPNQQYDIFELHFAFTDTGVNSYRTEKELTIVAPYNASGADADAKHPINDVITALNTLAGTSIDVLK